MLYRQLSKVCQSVEAWKSRARRILFKDGFLQGSGKVVEVGLGLFIPKNERNIFQVFCLGQPLHGVLSKLADLQRKGCNAVFFTSNHVSKSRIAKGSLLRLSLDICNLPPFTFRSRLSNNF